MQQQIQFNLSYYVTSSFALLPLTGTTSIVAAIVGGVIKLVCLVFLLIQPFPARCATSSFALEMSWIVHYIKVSLNWQN